MFRLRRLLSYMFFALLTTSAWAQPPKHAEVKKRQVAIVLYDGVELLDFAGPAEVFQAARHNWSQAFEVYTVAAKPDPITSQSFLKVVPNYTIENCPKPDIIVIPGGQTKVLLANSTIMAWLKKSAPETEVMFSVCTGAFALGELGLLDNQDATTHYTSLSGLQSRYPKARVQRNRRFVDNGKVITTAGVSAGMDGALHLVARLCGPDTAKHTAQYMEYKWEPETLDSPPK